MVGSGIILPQYSSFHLSKFVSFIVLLNDCKLDCLKLRAISHEKSVALEKFSVSLIAIGPINLLSLLYVRQSDHVKTLTHFSIFLVKNVDMWIFSMIKHIYDRTVVISDVRVIKLPAFIDCMYFFVVLETVLRAEARYVFSKKFVVNFQIVLNPVNCFQKWTSIKPF